jgi:hypothetical protein
VCRVLEKVDSEKVKGVHNGIREEKQLTYRYTRLFNQEILIEIRKEQASLIPLLTVKPLTAGGGKTLFYHFPRVCALLLLIYLFCVILNLPG